jgi:hypothetical protein
MSRCCRVWDGKPHRGGESITLSYRVAGPIPPKYRLRYAGNAVASADTAISNIDLKRARAANRKADKHDRRVAREKRATAG